MPKISELDAGTATGTDLIAVTQGSTTIKSSITSVVTAGPVASSSANGLMSSSDKSKLDGIPSTGASIPVVFTGYATGTANALHSDYKADTTLIRVEVARQKNIRYGTILETTKLVYASGATQVIS